MASFDVSSVRINVRNRKVGNDGGPSLQVYDNTGLGSEALRFDIFENDPHWHPKMDGRDPIHLDPTRDFSTDGIAWTIDKLSHELPELLIQAGFPQTELALDVSALKAILPRIEARWRAGD